MNGSSLIRAGYYKWTLKLDDGIDFQSYIVFFTVTSPKIDNENENLNSQNSTAIETEKQEADQKAID